MRHVSLPASPVLYLLLCAVLLLPAVLGSAPARAETRIFIIANQPDGYGGDLCLAKGERCGETAARSYCQSKDFAEATGFRKVEADDVTGALPREAKAGSGSHSGEYVAITCSR